MIKGGKMYTVEVYPKQISKYDKIVEWGVHCKRTQVFVLTYRSKQAAQRIAKLLNKNLDKRKSK